MRGMPCVGWGRTVFRAVIDAKEDVKYNEHAIDLLIKHNLILMKEFCSHLAHILHERINMPNMPHSRLLDSSPYFKLQLKLGVHLCNNAKGGEGRSERRISDS